jgi:hypothetical protein
MWVHNAEFFDLSNTCLVLADARQSMRLENDDAKMSAIFFGDRVEEANELKSGRDHSIVEK